MDDTAFLPAVDLAALVRAGTASAREVVEAALRRIEALDVPLNAFVEVDGDRAVAAAEEMEPRDGRPFAGVPIAIKANVPVEGLCMDMGSRFLAGHRPDHTA
ncbi:MAG TPA: amidase family protein, partial [Solirubrobacteraceae bacterium]